MNREDQFLNRNAIIRMAREAGMNLTPAQFSGVLEDEIDEFQLERFAALVAAAEREACAKGCLDMQNGWASDDHLQCGFAIRARGETK